MDNPHTPPKTDEAKTVRVRIAVAIAPDGTWASGGYWRHKNDKERADNVFLDVISEHEQIHFIEADVPVPIASTIEGALTNQPHGNATGGGGK